MQIPWVLSATSVIYNLPGVPNNLKLTGPVIANIYLGNDQEVERPGDQEDQSRRQRCPSTKITPVWRSDGSGTTYNFTDYLSAVSPQFKSKIGNSTQVNFPVGVGGRGSSGVAGVVKNTTGGIGYVDIAYALRTRSSSHGVRTAAGKYATPGLRGDHRRGGSRSRRCRASNEMHIVNPPKRRPARLPDLHLHRTSSFR